MLPAEGGWATRIPNIGPPMNAQAFDFTILLIRHRFFDRQKRAPKQKKQIPRMNSGFLPHLHILHNDKNCAGTA